MNEPSTVLDAALPRPDARPEAGEPRRGAAAPPPARWWARVPVAFVIVVPALATLVALGRLPWHLPSWPAITFALLLALGTGFGITVGFHRLFTHRSFRAVRPVRVGFAVLGSLALEGSISSWVATHRVHHRESDQPADPHSPVAGEPGARRGFWHAHVGWLLTNPPAGTDAAGAPDIVGDRDLRVIDRMFPLLAIVSLIGPAVLGLAVTRSWAGALEFLLWAGLVRIFLVHHVTWTVNSACHLWGRQPYRTADSSRNLSWLALPTLGESWHNSHHAFPTSARAGLDRRQVDPSAALIRLLERLHLARNVRVPGPEIRARRAAASAA